MEKIKNSPCGLFAGLSGEERNSILQCLSAVEKSYPKEEMIFRTGTVTSSMGLVTEGAVEIFYDDYWGNHQILGTVGPGELFGESYACSKSPMTVAVRASENARVLFLEVGKILTVCSPACQFHSRLIQNLLYILAEKNLSLTRKIDHMGQRTIREKVMSYLSFQAGVQNSGTFCIPFNRQQLADYLAVDRSALSAELSRMQKEGIIEYERNQFMIKEKTR